MRFNKVKIALILLCRFVSDANWPLVVSATALNHPYKGAGFTEDFEDSLEDEDFLGYRFTVCPECRKNIPTEPTSKEMREMTREAKLRVLKLKKVAYSRQFESGIISKEGVRILHQTLDIAKDTEDATVDLQPLFKMFNKENSFYRCLKERLLSIFKSQEDSLSHPRMYWRYICFCIITHIWFKIFIYSIIFLNLIFVVYHFLNNSHQTSVQFLIIVSLDALFFTIYFVEFWITIFAYSWIYVCKHGFGTYFRYDATRSLLFKKLSFLQVVLEPNRLRRLVFGFCQPAHGIDRRGTNSPTRPGVLPRDVVRRLVADASSCLAIRQTNQGL